MIGLLMQKVGMASVFNNGKVVSATLLKTQNPKVLKVVKNENGKYMVTIGFFDISENEMKRYNRSYLNGSSQDSSDKKKLIKTFSVNQQMQPRFVAYFDKLDQVLELEKGNLKISDLFSEGLIVDLYGMSKGCGFAGGIKRWNFKGLRASHGVSVSHRAIGSTGCRKPNRVLKGKKMPGRFGNDNICVRNLRVLAINDAQQTILVKGSVPGYSDSFVKILVSNKNKLTL